MNRWSSECHQARLDGRVVTEEGVANDFCCDTAPSPLVEMGLFGWWRRSKCDGEISEEEEVKESFLCFFHRQRCKRLVFEPVYVKVS